MTHLATKIAKNALVFGIAGLLTARALELENFPHFSVLAACASALAAATIACLMRNHRSLGIVRGAAVGVGIAFFAHPIHWYLTFTTNWGHALWTGAPTADLVDPLTALYASPVYSLYSWIFAGGATLLGGAIAGMIAASLDRGDRHPSAVSTELQVEAA